MPKKKKITALTGSILILFMVHHSLASMLILLNDHTFNSFSSALYGHPPLLYSARTFLTITLLAHIYYSKPYFKKGNWGEIKLLTGLLLLIFTIFHITEINAIGSATNIGEPRDLALIMRTHFNTSLTAVLTYLAIGVMGIHLLYKIDTSFFFYLSKTSQKFTLSIRVILSIIISLGLSLSLYEFLQ